MNFNCIMWMGSGNGYVDSKWALKPFTVDFSKDLSLPAVWPQHISFQWWRWSLSAFKGAAHHFIFPQYKRSSVGQFHTKQAFYSAMEIMGAAQWVATSSLVQKGLRTKIQFCDVGHEEGRLDVETRSYVFCLKIWIPFPLTFCNRTRE